MFRRRGPVSKAKATPYPRVHFYLQFFVRIGVCVEPS